MAFFGKLKSVLGFSGVDYELEDEELLQADATVTPLSQRRPIASAPTSGSKQEDVPAKKLVEENAVHKGEAAIERKCPEAIFNKVVAIFNESLPTFIRESIDPEKQSRYIHDALDDSMKSYIAQLDKDAEARMKEKLDEEQTVLRREIETLREKAKKIEDTSAEWQEQKLSAERQKRALSERVHDLEKQVDAFTAEKEQYELENKSLVNKLRAMSIQDGDMEELRKDNDALRQELAKLKENATTTIVPAVDQETIKQLTELKEKSEDLTAQKENLLRERNNLANDIVVLKKKIEISDAMLNDLNHKASAAKQALSEKETQYNELQERYDALAATSSSHEIEQRLQEALSLSQQRQDEIAAVQCNLNSAHDELQRVNSELHNETVKVQQLTEELRIAKEQASQPVGNDTAEDATARDATIAQLKEELSQSKSELAEAKAEVEECRTSLANFEASLIKIDEINSARQSRIIELQQQLNEKETTLESATQQLSENKTLLDEKSSLIEKKEEEIAALKAKLENNQQLQVASEAMLREEIERLRKASEPAPRQKRKKSAQISSIDDTLDDTNWLVSTPPEGTNARPVGVSDSEFGYQEPKQRGGSPDNPAQMSLW